MIKWPEPVMHGLKAAAGHYGNICYSTLAMAEHSIKHNPPSVGYTAVSYCTESQLKQAVRDAIEMCARASDCRDLPATSAAIRALIREICMITKDQAIAPCPFCGHVGLDFNEGSTFRWLSADCTKCGATCGETRIQTLGEGTKEEWMVQAQRDAIEVWNTRKPAPDCRTCRHFHHTGCMVTAMHEEGCTNGDKYQEAPPVVLWRTE